MRPPICKICKKRFSARSKSIPPAGLVYFKLSEEDKARNDYMKEKRMVGHPRGREWFCEVHYSIAKEYTHLTINEALPLIKTQSKESE